MEPMKSIYREILGSEADKIKTASRREKYQQNEMKYKIATTKKITKFEPC